MKKLFFIAAVAMAAVLSCTKPEDNGGSTDSGVEATKIDFAEKNYTVVAGETVTLKLVATPENASLKGVEFSSNHEDLATVSADAVVTGVKAGNVTITAKLGRLKATTKVKVEAVPVPATGIKVDKESVTVGVGKTVTVTASLLPEGTTDQLNATWKSADETIATVADGVIRGVKQGTTKVTVSQGELKADVAVTVEAGSIKDRSADWKATATARWQSSWSGMTAVTDVKLEKCDASMFYFAVMDQDATFDLDAANEALQTMIDEYKGYGEDEVARLFNTSVPVTRTAYRTGKITAYVLSYTDDYQFNDEFAVFSFDVADPDPVHATGIKLSESTLTLTEGKSTQLTASFEPDGCTDEPAFEWKSSDESVVKLTEGYSSNYINVSAVAEGKATVTVTHGELSAKCEVTVEKDNVVWTKVDNWEYKYGKVEEYGTEYDGFILTSCTAGQHAIVDLDEETAEYYGVTGELSSVEAARAVAAYYGDYISWYTSDQLPHGHAVYYDAGSTWIYVLGMEDGAFTGEYMIVKYEPESGNGGDSKWVDCSSKWNYSYGTTVDQTVGRINSFTLESCTDPAHYLGVVSVEMAKLLFGNDYTDMDAIGDKFVDALDEYSTNIPHTEGVYTTGDYVIYVVGINEDHTELTGNYMILTHTFGAVTEPHNIVRLTGSEYFPVDWDSMDAVQSEVTMEGWVYSSSFSGGNDKIYTVMGTEGIFLLRFEENKLNLVYGGAKRTDKNEYVEQKVTCNTAFETNKWYHIAATYVAGGDVILYVNGAEVGRKTAEDHDIELNGIGAEWVLPFKFYVGVSSNKRTWKGSLAYLRVWDCARTAKEIKDNMNVADPDDDGENLMASWHFDEGLGSTIKDYGATKDYNLTVAGSASLFWQEGYLPF